ncbi:hypothetical protein V8Z80_02690 [Orrella sp. JC864]|uniref:hypothetical protein n=1 Tax=Orrella sp. JC864 TaxID=3120298 RepID=UPI00300A1FE6
MPIFIPGALPPAPVAPELAKRLPDLAPTLLDCFERYRAQTRAMDPHALGCTPAEAWQLERAGFAPQAGQRLGAGLGPLRAQARPPSPAAAPPQAGAGAAGQGHADAPVWLADLVHLAIGTDRARLADPCAMRLSPQEDQALFEAARPWLDDSPFRAEPLAPGRWRMALPEGMAPPSASPAAVAADAVHDWWPQDAAMRPWRRLLNAVQMAWHEHPVNQAREARGELPVNGLWLYGGARPWPLAPLHDPVLAQLEAPHRAGDWAAWLDALAQVEAALRGQHPPGPDQPLVLSGAGRIVQLTPVHGPALLRWLPRRKQNWNRWWSLPD